MQALDLNHFASALVVKPSSLGDIVHTLPAVHAIKSAHPQLKLRWVVKPEWRALIDGSPDIDEVIDFPQREFRGLLGKAGAARWAFRLNKQPRETPEIVLDFQGLLRSAIISTARGSRPIVGLSDAREGASRFYDHTVQVDAGAHAVDRYLELPRALGVNIGEPVFPMRMGDELPQLAGQRFVVVHPWSRGAGKSLAAHELQVLCDCLTTTRVIIVGMKKNPQSPRGSHILDLTNKTTLPQLLWLLRAARFVISVDSGPMHIAAAVNDAVLSVHTWSDPRKVGPYNAKCFVWKAGRIAHREEFTPEECTSTLPFTEGHARRVADAAIRALA